MLTLSIREKNGEERQLVFDKEEVTIGRASGSDIVLPRNNISKRHARLVDKHDKVVIVDLRSTNGTYVNGRRITAPELLTTEDKVYIGDFVIKLQRPGEHRATAPFGVGAAPQAAAPANQAAQAVDPRTSHAPTVAVGRVPQHAIEEDAAARAVAAVEEAEAVPAPPVLPANYADEDESTKAFDLADIEAIDAAHPEPAAPAPAPEPEPEPEPAPKPQPKKAKAEPKRAAKAPAPKPKAPEPAPAPVEDEEIGVEEEEEVDAWAGWNATVAVVLEGIEAASSGRELSWEDAARIADGFVAKAVEAGRIAEDVERDALVADAVTEAVGLGPLADLLADDEVSRVAVDGPEVLRVWRGGGSPEPSGRVFSSHASYERVLRRLLTDAGVPEGPLAPVVEATLPSGESLTVVSAPIATDGALLVLRRPPRIRPTFDELIAGGVLDETIAKGIETAIADGHNIVVAGAPGSGRTTLLSAIVGLAGPDERLVVVGDGHEIVAPQPDLARVARRSTANDHTALYGSVTRLRPDRVVVDDIDADNILAVMSLALSGGAPVLVAARDGDPERLLRRLAMQIDLANGGNSDRGRYIVGEALDLLVCLERGDDGQPTVTRLVAVESADDGFSHRILAKRQ